MTMSDDLSAVVGRLEKASGPDRELDEDIARAIGAWSGRDDRLGAYTASIDSAMSLVPEGFYWEVAHGHIANGKGPYWASCYNDAMLGEMLDGDADIPGATPAIALCIASLKARGRQQSQPQGGGE